MGRVERYIYRSMDGENSSGINVGKYTVRPMDGMGYTLYIYILLKYF